MNLSGWSATAMCHPFDVRLDVILDARPRLRGAYEFVREFVREFGEDRVSSLSAEVAFWWVLSLFPALLVLTAVLGLLGSDISGQVETSVVDGVKDFFGASDDDPVVSQAQAIFDQPSAGVLTASIVLALWTTSRSFLSLIQAIDVIYDLEEKRGYIRLRLFGLVMGTATIVIAAVALALVVVGPLLGAGTEVMDRVGLDGGYATAWDWLRAPVAFGVIVVWTATIYHVAPARRTAWRWDLPGALLSTVWWLAASAGFRLYLAYSGDSSLVVGVLGGALTLALWLWLLAMGLMVGAQLNAVMVQRWGVEQFVAPGVANRVKVVAARAKKRRSSRHDRGLPDDDPTDDPAPEAVGEGEREPAGGQPTD
jgi:membrane protein